MRQDDEKAKERQRMIKFSTTTWEVLKEVDILLAHSPGWQPFDIGSFMKRAWKWTAR